MTENVEAAKTEETAKAAEPKVNPLEKKIEFSVKTADLEAGVAVELKKLGKKAKLPGFRVGHVPAAKVAEMYGYEANNRVMNRLIEEAYVEAAKASGLKFAGFPKIAGAEGANKPGDGSAREQAASCQRVLGAGANIAVEYATKRYRSNLINWGMLPFQLAGATPFGLGDYILIPNIREALKGDLQNIPAYVLGGAVKPFTLYMAPLTADERQILADGCLINFYKH